MCVGAVGASRCSRSSRCSTVQPMACLLLKKSARSDVTATHSDEIRGAGRRIDAVPSVTSSGGGGRSASRTNRTRRMMTGRPIGVMHSLLPCHPTLLDSPSREKKRLMDVGQWQEDAAPAVALLRRLLDAQTAGRPAGNCSCSAAHREHPVSPKSAPRPSRSPAPPQGSSRHAGNSSLLREAQWARPMCMRRLSQARAAQSLCSSLPWHRPQAPQPRPKVSCYGMLRCCGSMDLAS